MPRLDCPRAREATRLWLPMLPTVGAALLSVVSGCGDDLPPGADVDPASTTGNAGDGDAVQDTGTTTASETDDDADAESETGFDPPVLECGNGFVEEGEQCDDGNRRDDDACNNACQVPCGLAGATLVLPPTDESVFSADHVAVTAQDGAVVAGLLRVITTDQRGNQEIAPDVTRVLRFDDAGRLSWTAEVANPQGDIAPDGVVVDGRDDIYLANTGEDPAGESAIIVTKLAGEDGQELWRHVFAGDTRQGDELATGIALHPDGVVVAGQVRAGDGDDDIWVRLLDTADGAEVWSASYSGVASGGFSTDDAGPVAVDPQGRVWVLGIEYVDFETSMPVLLRFGATGGPVEVIATPTLAGSEQNYFAIDLQSDDAGVAMAYGRNLGSDFDIRLTRYDTEGTEVFSLDPGAVRGLVGSDPVVRGIALGGGEMLVVGSVTNDVTIPEAAWTEVWVARLGADASVRCLGQARGTARGLLPPSIVAADGTVASDATGLVSGVHSVDGDASLWLGRFRPE